MSLTDQQPIAGATVSAIVAADEDGWLATVLIAREPDQPPVGAGDVEVRLDDAAGHPLELLGSPQAQWVEAGGSAGTTANGEYRFRGDNAPHELAVSWQGETVRLAVTPSARSPR